MDFVEFINNDIDIYGIYKKFSFERDSLKEEFTYLLFLSIYCIDCIGVFSEYKNEQDFFINNKILIVVDCKDSNQIEFLKSQYGVKGPMKGLFEMEFLKEIAKKHPTTPFLLNINDEKLPQKINSISDLKMQFSVS